ncbi:2-hydroxychromene-2-carboxylate isomerase [Kitasatospora sp. NPDC057936]|uniref:2-hydroxychromene-2-carboxylate isomerase n=1 Tax=Kitasatospora sp. NPDC057936 TaxID=3346283 RepID=UPI0036DBCBC3
MARRAPRWYFSFRSPYSWMAYRDLVDHHPQEAERIEWLPFWEPDPSAQDELEQSNIRLPYVPMSKEKHLYILQDVRRLARARDLEMVWPVDPAPRWEVSHLAYLAAERRGVGREFIAETYRTRWERGEDISRPDTMRKIAETIGADPEALARAHEDPEIRELGMAALGSLHRDGVFGVPFFICGFDKYWGVDRLPDFLRRLQSLKVS